MALYTYHYATGQADEPYHLTCARIAQAISNQRLGAPRPDYGSESSTSDEDEDDHPCLGLGFRGAPARAPGPALAVPGPALAAPALAVPVVPALAAPVVPAATPVDLDNADYWQAALRFQWALRSDRAVSARAITELAADLQADGELEMVRLAFRRLAAALAAAYPSLGTDMATLVQLAALGRDMAVAAGQSPDLFAYVKNELQPVNLAALLRV